MSVPVSAALPGLPLWLEIAAMGTSGFFGAVVAANRRIPVLGVLAGGLIVGLGGGILRDMMLNVQPTSISQPLIIPAVGATSLLGALLGRFLGQSRLSLVALQALSVALLVVIGAEKGMVFGVSWWAVIVLAIITATAGGAAFDALSGTRSALLSQGRWHLTSLAVGALVFIIVSQFGSVLTAEIATVATIVGLRLLSYEKGWNCPEIHFDT